MRWSYSNPGACWSLSLTPYCKTWQEVTPIIIYSAENRYTCSCAKYHHNIYITDEQHMGLLCTRFEQKFFRAKFDCEYQGYWEGPSWKCRSRDALTQQFSSQRLRSVAGIHSTEICDFSHDSNPKCKLLHCCGSRTFLKCIDTYV